ncbi:hypothetical protein LCGC14_2181110, partial [marine sediment metagenome]
ALEEFFSKQNYSTTLAREAVDFHKKWIEEHDN